MSKMLRVSKANPCPACGKDSWCLIGEKATLCMRVQSSKPYTLKNSGELGYWHEHDKTVVRPPMPKQKEPPRIDANKLIGIWKKGCGIQRLEPLAEDLGVSVDSLVQMMAVWAPGYEAWAFPMRDGNGFMCGIRLRRDDGSKFCVTGSRTGIFLPFCQPRNTVFLVEGPTDCAALLTIGLYAIGRPSNSGGLDIIKQTISRLHIERAVIIADNDQDQEAKDGRKFNPGYDGAQSLARNLMVPCCVMALPCKDAREFVSNGGTREMLENQLDNMLWEHQ